MVTNTVKTEKVYTDFPTNFQMHPIRKDLTVISNEDAVKSSIRNLLLTNYYERNDPTVGANLDAQLFELITPLSQIVVEDSIRKCIENFEPRAKIISLLVAPDPDRNQWTVELVFTVLNNTEPTTLSVPLLQKVSI